MPVCPLGGTYVLGPVKGPPKCVRPESRPPRTLSLAVLVLAALFSGGLFLQLKKDLFSQRAADDVSPGKSRNNRPMIFLIVLGLSTCVLLPLTAQAWNKYKRTVGPQHSL
jgi:hypothetical protein